MLTIKKDCKETEVKCKDLLFKMSQSECGGLAWSVRVAINNPYCINVNIDVSDGLVYGSIGILRYIEYEVFLEKEKKISTLWFEFPKSKMGNFAKIKCKPHDLSKPGILISKWVPIYKRKGSIKICPGATCSRVQFPISLACVMTIHKSQGGTFDSVVYKYSPGQEHQLVYVALSRVTSIDGLHIITEDDKALQFKHGKYGCDSETMRSIKKEFRRLNLPRNRLPTITHTALEFINKSSTSDILLLNLNV